MLPYAFGYFESVYLFAVIAEKLYKMTTAYLDWSLTAECPGCGEDVDCLDQDGDGILSGHVFNNAWELVKDYELTCPHCSHEFMLSGVEY